MKGKTLVALPAYNESGNIVALLRKIMKVGADACVIDDNSPDGTAGLVQRLIAGEPEARERIHLIVRSKKDGRGGAVRDGFAWGLANTAAEVFVEMDCDFSHSPEDIPRGIALLRDCDVAIGSRYPGGRIIGWPAPRKILSYCANLLAKTLISRKLADYTNGFRFYTRRATEFLIGRPQKHKGFIYLSETISYLLKAGYEIKTFPIVFVNRKTGASNTTFSEIVRSLSGILAIAWSHRFGPRG